MTINRKKLVILLLAAFVASNTFSSAEVVEYSLTEPDAQQTNISLEERVKLIERLLNSDFILEMRTPISDLRQEIQALRGRIEVQEHLLKRGSIDQVPQSKPNNENKEQIKQDQLIEVNDEYSLYRKSYSLIKEKQYVEAEKELQSYLQKYPEGKYTVNAYYWLGEVNLVQSNYNLAVNYYDEVIKKFPQDQKSSTALFKKGMAYLYLHDITHAKNAFTDVMAKNPNSSISRLAESRLSQIESEFLLK